MQTFLVSVPMSIPYTANEWELYSSMEGSEDVAKTLADTVASELSYLSGRLLTMPKEQWDKAIGESESAMHKRLCQYSKYGAADSEPIWHLESIYRKYRELVLSKKR
jgi:hypothetical protein